MTDRLRTTALSLAWTLAACHRGGPPSAEPTPAPGPIAELDGSVELLPIVLVRQELAMEIDDWVFEPGGARLASTEQGDCTIWDIETGVLIRSLEIDAKPCVEWLPAVEFEDFTRDEFSADEQLALDISAGVAIVDVDTGRKLRDLACPDCATVDDVTWSDQGHQLALVWREAARVEIWDADTGQRVRAESIPIVGELQELELGWTKAGATLAWTELGFAVECDQYDSYYAEDCEWDEVEQVGIRRPLEGRISIIGPSGLSSVDTSAYVEMSFDPEFRWMFWTEEWSERREGTTTTMHFESLGEQESKLGWEAHEGFDDYGESLEREGSWRSDGATHWAVSISHMDYDGSMGMVEWETTMISPALGRRAGVILEGFDHYDSYAEVELLGFAGDGLGFTGEVCNSGACAPIGPSVAPNCTLLDVGSGHGAQLLDCGGAAFLANSGALKQLPFQADEVVWWWSRGGALALHDGANFMVLDAVIGDGIGDAKQPRKDVDRVLEGRLGTELERLVLRTEAGIELLDLTTGKTILSLPNVAPDAVALSPNADRLAVLEAGEIRVLALPGGEPIVSWASAGPELAFRQDGEVIFVGDLGPELLFDASTGKAVSDPSLAKIIAAIDEGGEIDPSWRWIMNDERSELTRTVDGRVLAWRGLGAWLTDTGQYVGIAPGFEVRFRVGDDPWAVPSFSAQELHEWLERPDLIQAFATGQAIAAPGMTPSALAGLNARPKPEPVN